MIHSASENELVESTNRLPKGYEWKVVFDPTRTGDDPGLFYGRLFRIFDIRIRTGEDCTWPDGIIFQSIKTSEKKTYRQGKLITVACELE